MARRGPVSADGIHHDETRHRYSLRLEGVEAYLTYEQPREGLIHITHTIVPEAIGGRGIGKRLVHRAVGDALARGDALSSSCWFATVLIEKKPAWREALV